MTVTAILEDGQEGIDEVAEVWRQESAQVQKFCERLAIIQQLVELVVQYLLGDERVVVDQGNDVVGQQVRISVRSAVNE